MYICVCHAVRDKEIDAHIRAGCRTVHAVAEACGAGTSCGSCRPALRDQIKKLHVDTRGEDPFEVEFSAVAK